MTAATGPRGRRRRARRAADAAGVVVVTFGLHSAIDWTWFIPARRRARRSYAPAGWPGAGRSRGRSVGWRARRAARTVTPSTGRRGGGSPWPPVPSTQAIARSPGRSGTAAALAATALVSAWTVWQPLRSANAEQAALAELGAGHVAAALADARSARARDPVAVTPLWDMSVIYDVMGDTGAARGALVSAVRLQPSNAATWVQLAQYDLKLGQLHDAAAALRTAVELGPHERDTLAAVEQLQAAQARAAAAALAQRRSRGHRHGRRPR